MTAKMDKQIEKLQSEHKQKLIDLYNNYLNFPSKHFQIKPV